MAAHSRKLNGTSSNSKIPPRFSFQNCQESDKTVTHGDLQTEPTRRTRVTALTTVSAGPSAVVSPYLKEPKGPLTPYGRGLSWPRRRCVDTRPAVTQCPMRESH